MTEKEILEKQVEALEKLLQIKEAIIQEHEAKITKLEMEKMVWQPSQLQPLPFSPLRPMQQPQYPGISIPSVWTVDPCTDGQYHEYDNPWYSTQPQPCKKCGKATQPHFTVTSSNTVSMLDDEERALGTITDIANKKTV